MSAEDKQLPVCYATTMDERVVMHQGRETMTLRQIDRLNGTPKGTAFRAFKRVRPRLREGEHFFRLDASANAEFIASLRRSGVVYPSTVHLVLITRSGYERLCGAAYSQGE